MSQLKVNSIVDAAGGSSAVLYGVASPPNSMGFRNRIINGEMRIDQRNAGASVTPTSDGTYTLDRWQVSLSAASKFSIQQSTVAPSSFANSVLVTSLSAYSLPSNGYFMLNQPVEGFNVADLAWGTASAKPVTLSFWVRSSLTGTFGGAVQNSAQNRGYPFSYTINAANTWEQKTVTIAGDTTGTWVTNNGVGVFLRFGLGVGSAYSGTAGVWAAAQLFAPTGATSVVGTNGATFYITGVQLEAGTVATPFERRPYGTELALCQRYFIQMVGAAGNPAIGSGIQPNTTSIAGFVPLPVPMRSTPTVTAISGGVSSSDTFAYNTAITITTQILTTNGLYLAGSIASNGAQGRPMLFILNGTSAALGISAEL